MSRESVKIIMTCLCALATSPTTANADQPAPIAGVQPAVAEANKEFLAKFSAMVSASPTMSLALLTLKPTSLEAMGPPAPHQPAAYSKGCATGQGPLPGSQAIPTVAPSFASKVTLRDRLKAPLPAADKKPQTVKGWVASTPVPGPAAKGAATTKQSKPLAVPVATTGGPKFGEFKY